MTGEASTTTTQDPPPDPDKPSDADDGGSRLDYRRTPLNACSVETYCWNDDGDSGTTEEASSSSSSLVPLCLGCYQLNESTGQREGRLDLYAVPVDNHTGDDDGDTNATSVQSFGDDPPLTILGGGGDGAAAAAPAPGVLDGKWSPPAAGSNGHDSDGRFRAYYATAHANGEIWVHDVRGDATGASSGSPFGATLAGKSESPSESGGLCLALAWEQPLYNNGSGISTDDDGVFDTRIVSSYSDGHAAIHRVRQRPSSLSSLSSERQPPEPGLLKLELTLEHHWKSHTIFGVCPAEVWCACFVDSETVATGGDDGSWKVWDLRAPLTGPPVHHAPDDFGAGVTVLSPHPRLEKLLAVGSYDETIALFDLRYSGSSSSGGRRRPPRALYRSESLGGGIWRCKWHPTRDDRLLVAAMHGGCAMGDFGNLRLALGGGGHDIAGTAAAVGFEVRRRFGLHKSMAYGIDWLVGGNNQSCNSRTADVAASCSFYDRAMYLWNA